MMYQTIKRMGGLYNYGVEHRFELRTKRDLETKQYMRNAEGAEWHLNTRYTCFRRERDAEKQYDKNIENERLTEERWQERGMSFLPPRKFPRNILRFPGCMSAARSGANRFPIMCFAATAKS